MLKPGPVQCPARLACVSPLQSISPLCWGVHMAMGQRGECKEVGAEEPTNQGSSTTRATRARVPLFRGLGIPKVLQTWQYPHTFWPTTRVPRFD